MSWISDDEPSEAYSNDEGEFEPTDDEFDQSRPASPRLEDIQYSREATIAAFTSYYEFLTTMYLDSEHVMVPPADGWPEITTESMRSLGKSDEIVELLRHLPYVRRPSDGTHIHSSGMCEFADWTSYARSLADSSNDQTESAEYVLLKTERPWKNIPSHVVGLVSSKDYKMFLDTELGVIYFPGTPSASPGPFGELSGVPHKPVSDDALDYAPEEEIEWRGATGCWAISDFFEVLKYHFRQLNYVPMSRQIVDESWILEDDEEDAVILEIVQGIFRKHGWPDDLARYEKDRCLEEVERAVEEHRPGRFFAW